MDGYHWVDDEFYLTTCGGEVIIGTTDFLADDDDEDGVFGENGGGETGGMFAMEDNDDAIADDAQDDFYCIRMPPLKEATSTSREGSGSERKVHVASRPVSGEEI